MDAAEDLFAERGYSATSLGDVADRVGIRSPSLYNHFRNKEALYSEVLDRLLREFARPLEELQEGPLNRKRILQWLEISVRLHYERPNLARMLQHAALSGGPQASAQASALIERLFSPMFAPADIGDWQLGPELQPWAVMALNNMVMSYITMAPMYRELLGEDPLSPQAIERQLALILKVAQLALGPALGPTPEQDPDDAPRDAAD